MTIKDDWKDRFFTPEEIAQMEAVFNEQFFVHLKKDENISFEGFFADGACHVTCTLKNADETFFYPFEAAISSKEHVGLPASDARNLILDFIGAYFEEYFADNRETYVPVEWVVFRIEDTNIHARGQIMNKKLEKHAEDILKSAGFDEDGFPTKKGTKKQE
jgi:hypothetical protein